MTCIAAVADGERVWIGGDSAGVAGWSLELRADEKVFTNGLFVMGFIDLFRMGQLLRYAFVPPEPPSDREQMDRYMVTDFVNAVRQCLKDGGFAGIKDQVEQGGTFIVGIRSYLYVVESDYQVGKLVEGYAAVGSGADIALGSLCSTRSLSPEQRIKMALDAAESHCASVRRPFVVKHNGLLALEATA